MLCPPFFLLQICEGKIGAANPKFFVSIKKIDSKQKPPDLAEVGLRPLMFILRNLISGLLHLRQNKKKRVSSVCLRKRSP
jgi:hypothetical protein